MTGTEFAENAIRKDFVATEMHAIREAVSKVMAAEAKQRMKEAGREGGKEAGRGRKSNRGTAKNGTPKKRGKTSAQQTAAFAGTSETTMRKIAKVMEAAKAEPDKYGDLVAMMDAGNVNAASVVSCALTADMGTTMATRLSYTELLVWHAIKGRAVNGVAVATDRLIAQEVALSPLTVRGIRGSLQAAGRSSARRSPARQLWRTMSWSSCFLRRWHRDEARDIARTCGSTADSDGSIRAGASAGGRWWRAGQYPRARSGGGAGRDAGARQREAPAGSRGAVPCGARRGGAAAVMRQQPLLAAAAQARQEAAGRHGGEGGRGNSKPPPLDKGKGSREGRVDRQLAKAAKVGHDSIARSTLDGVELRR